MSDNNEGTAKILKLGLILFTVTAITGLILGVVHDITAAPIKLTQERLKNEALALALPEADSFEVIGLAQDASPILAEVQRAKNGADDAGYCITVVPKGYGGPIEIVVGVTNEGGLRAIRILNQSETPGLGAKAPDPTFSGQFKDKNVERLSIVKAPPSAPDHIQAISGATITSTAVTDGVNAALEYWKTNLRGGN